jgi:Mg/Co/Ni transporter MgtE
MLFLRNPTLKPKYCQLLLVVPSTIVAKKHRADLVIASGIVMTTLTDVGCLLVFLGLAVALIRQSP